MCKFARLLVCLCMLAIAVEARRGFWILLHRSRSGCEPANAVLRTKAGSPTETASAVKHRALSAALKTSF